METEALSRTQKKWAESSLDLLRELLPLASVVARYPDWTSDERQTLGAMFTACARSSESVLLLCAFGQVWDAELISRSVFEGSLKLAYLLQTSTDFKSRYEAYSNALFEIALLNDHRKATDVLSIVPDPEGREWQPIREILLTDAERDRIGTRYDRAVRRRLQEEWGFTGLIPRLASASDLRIDGVSALAHGYSIASHVQHMDFTGVSLPLERDFRSPDRRDSIHMAHVARLISDVFACFILRLAAAYRYVGEDQTPLAKASERIKSHQIPCRTAYEEWLDIEFPTERRVSAP